MKQITKSSDKAETEATEFDFLSQEAEERNAMHSESRVEKSEWHQAVAKY